jgi:hypothetical protein
MRRTTSILITVLVVGGIAASAAGARTEPTRTEPSGAIGEPNYRSGPKATLSLTDRLEPGHAPTRVQFVLSLRRGGSRAANGTDFTMSLQPGAWTITATPLTTTAKHCDGVTVKLTARRHTYVTLKCSA